MVLHSTCAIFIGCACPKPIWEGWWVKGNQQEANQLRAGFFLETYAFREPCTENERSRAQDAMRMAPSTICVNAAISTCEESGAWRHGAKFVGTPWPPLYCQTDCFSMLQFDFPSAEVNTFCSRSKCQPKGLPVKRSQTSVCCSNGLDHGLNFPRISSPFCCFH